MEAAAAKAKGCHVILSLFNFIETNVK